MEKRSKKNASLYRKIDKEIAKKSFLLSDSFSYPDNYLKLRVLRNKESYGKIDQQIRSMKTSDSYFHETYSVLSKIDRNYFGNTKEIKKEEQEKKHIGKKQKIIFCCIFFLLILLIIGLAVGINGK